MKAPLLTAACLALLPAVVAAQDAATAAAMTIRVGGFMINGQRNYAFNKTVEEGTGTVKGVEAYLQRNEFAFSLRSSSGSFTNTAGGAKQPDVVGADGNVFYVRSNFAVSVGAAKRALSSTATNSTRVFTFGRVGGQMSVLIGGTGLRAQVGAWGFVPVSSDVMKSGAEGDGSIIYTPQRYPVFVQLGYRTEVFTSKVGSLEAPEEVRGLRIGGGYQIGGK